MTYQIFNNKDDRAYLSVQYECMKMAFEDLRDLLKDMPANNHWRSDLEIREIGNGKMKVIDHNHVIICNKNCSFTCKGERILSTKHKNGIKI